MSLSLSVCYLFIQIAVHNPSEKPSFHHYISYIEVNKVSFLYITPKLIGTDPVLRDWTPKERGCYFEGERKLLFFNVYTHKNCEVECEANITLKICECNSFFQPRKFFFCLLQNGHFYLVVTYLVVYLVNHFMVYLVVIYFKVLIL